MKKIFKRAVPTVASGVWATYNATEEEYAKARENPTLAIIKDGERIVFDVVTRKTPDSRTILFYAHGAYNPQTRG